MFSVWKQRKQKQKKWVTEENTEKQIIPDSLLHFPHTRQPLLECHEVSCLKTYRRARRGSRDHSHVSFQHEAMFSFWEKEGKQGKEKKRKEERRKEKSSLTKKSGSLGSDSVAPWCHFLLLDVSQEQASLCTALGLPFALHFSSALIEPLVGSSWKQRRKEGREKDKL